MAKYLDSEGLKHFWSIIKSTKADKAKTLAGYGIEDVYIQDGTIYVAGNSLTPVTSTEMEGKADIDSPAFEGVPTVPTANADDSSEQIANTEFVQNAINSKLATADALVYKGTLGVGGTITSLPSDAKVGYTYKVVTAGTYNDEKCEVGDMLICLTEGETPEWTVVQSNIDGVVVGPTSSEDQHIPVFSGENGNILADSGLSITDITDALVIAEPSDNEGNGGKQGLLSPEMAYKLSQLENYTHPAHTPHTDLGLYKITVDNKGHINSAEAVTKEDLVSIIGTLDLDVDSIPNGDIDIICV